MESRVARIEGVVERLEKVTEKLTDTVTAIHREFAERRHQDREIERLRAQGHEHANRLEHLTLLERRFAAMEQKLDELRVQAARNAVIVSIVAGGIAAAVAAASRHLLG